MLGKPIVPPYTPASPPRTPSDPPRDGPDAPPWRWVYGTPPFGTGSEFYSGVFCIRFLHIAKRVSRYSHRANTFKYHRLNQLKILYKILNNRVTIYRQEDNKNKTVAGLLIERSTLHCQNSRAKGRCSTGWDCC